MSIQAQNEINELRRRVEALEADVRELQSLLQAMTRQSTPKGKAA